MIVYLLQPCLGRVHACVRACVLVCVIHTCLRVCVCDSVYLGVSLMLAYLHDMLALVFLSLLFVRQLWQHSIVGREQV